MTVSPIRNVGAGSGSRYPQRRLPTTLDRPWALLRWPRGRVDAQALARGDLDAVDWELVPAWLHGWHVPGASFAGVLLRATNRSVIPVDRVADRWDRRPNWPMVINARALLDRHGLPCLQEAAHG